MLYFRLRDGRQITLEEIHLVPTFHLVVPAGLEGLRDRVMDQVRRYFPKHRAICIMCPETGNVPTTLCIAEFTSSGDASGTGASYLVLAWFVWHLDRHLREIGDCLIRVRRRIGRRVVALRECSARETHGRKRQDKFRFHVLLPKRMITSSHNGARAWDRLRHHR